MCIKDVEVFKPVYMEAVLGGIAIGNTVQNVNTRMRHSIYNPTGYAIEGD